MTDAIKFAVRYCDYQRRPFAFDLIDASGAVVHKGLFRFRTEDDCREGAKQALVLAAAQSAEVTA